MTQLLTPPTGQPRQPDHSSSAVAVRADDLVKTYGHGAATVRALDGATVDLHRGAFTAIMGPSGSGKSTLMHALAGLDSVDSGRVVLTADPATGAGAVDVTDLTERQRTLLRRDRIGFVFQAFNLIPALTAAENICLPLTLAGSKPDSQWLARLVDTLGLADRLSHKPTELSGGQQQRVAVARALVSRPDVVFADEPTGNLDSRHGAALLDFLRDAAHDYGQTIVMVTHDPTAAGYADRVVFLADGRIVDEIHQPTPEAVLTRMAAFDLNHADQPGK
jgi:putative ABC transport system ATP-binding protein